jgi:tripartite-type tricarboxylate transporter receptor subunit TctC
MMQTKVRLMLALITIACAAPALAQDYPRRPVRLIVSMPPGGGSDIMARIVAAKLGERVGQQVVVDNRAGASGIIGNDLVAKSQPDGYTLLMAPGSFGAISALFKKLPFDVMRDFEPVAFIATSPYVFVVHPSLPVNSVSDFVAYAKGRPGKLNFAGSTSGSVQHLSGELLKRMAGIDMLYVPYKGTGLVMPDLIAGRLHAAFEGVLAIVPHIKSGGVRGIAVTSAKRSTVIPDLPTVAESGVPGFQSSGWFGIFGAAKTPQPIVSKLNSELRTLMMEPEMRDRLLGQGAEPVAGPPEMLRTHLAREMETWGKVIRDAGLKVE